ncbi:MAG: cell division protein ZapE [Rhodospirillales bacterium]|jgi:cell division protein ZapE|nr:cell division protein ZapE [Rhodospirillales bacterium]
MPQSGPLTEYRSRLRSGDLRPDTAQALAAEKLESLSNALTGYAPQSGPAGWKERFGLARRRTITPPQGLYIYGGVGRGKSMLMDIFFRTAPVVKKRRVHFHAFMQEIHARLADVRAEVVAGGRPKPGARARDGDVLPRVGRHIAADTHLLCFDEVQVLDIADAMILGRLFQALFDEGVVMVATSNRPPHDLYKDGLQRENFLPFIELIEQRLDLLHLDSPTDYRLESMRAMNVFLTPADPATDAKLRAYFARLTHGASVGPDSIEVLGRRLVIPMAADDIAFATFQELCEAPLGPADYLAIAERYEVVLLARIPQLGPEKRNEAKRFVTLVDALYEHKVKLICTAAAPAKALYPAGDGAFEFERTVSRLMEMQSEAYLGAQHLSQ